MSSCCANCRVPERNQSYQEVSGASIVSKAIRVKKKKSSGTSIYRHSSAQRQNAVKDAGQIPTPSVLENPAPELFLAHSQTKMAQGSFPW